MWFPVVVRWFPPTAIRFSLLYFQLLLLLWIWWMLIHQTQPKISTFWRFDLCQISLSEEAGTQFQLNEFTLCNCFCCFESVNMGVSLMALLLFPTRTKLLNNLGQIVHTCMPLSLSPSSITWYWSKDSDVLRLGSWLQAWQNVMAAYRPGWLRKSPVGWLPVHRDQLQAQRSVTSMG